MHTFDLRGTIISFSLLEISHRFKLMKEKDIVEVLWEDPDTRSALFKILPAASYDIIRDEKIEGSNAGFRVRLQKKI
jgi:hypothetical protein